MNKILLLISFSFISFISFAQIKEDDPYLNKIYLGIDAGITSYSAATLGVHAQSYFYDGRLGVSGRVGFKGPNFAESIFTDIYKSYAKYKERSPNGMSTPKEGMKNGYDTELGACYFFRRKTQRKRRKIPLGSKPAGDKTIVYSIRTEVKDIKMSGVRLGFGHYRGMLHSSTYVLENYFDFKNNMNQTNVNLWPTTIYSNYNTNYLYFGIQRTSIIDYYVNQAFMFWRRRRAVKGDFYADMMIQLRTTLPDIYLNSATNPGEKELHQMIEKTYFVGRAFQRLGFRVGYLFSTSRYARLSTGIEGGIIPGLRTALANGSGGNFEPRRSAGFFKLNINVSLTSPYKRMQIKEKK